MQPTSRVNVGFKAFHRHFVGSLRGVKRKSLASALTGSKSGSHHLDWTSSWDSEMPPDLLAKCRPLHCQLCDVQVNLSCWVYKGTSSVRSILSGWYFSQFKFKHTGDISGASKDALSREDSWQACQKLLHLPEQAEQPEFCSAYTPEIECKRPKNRQWGRRQATGSSLFHLWSCFYIIFTGLVLNVYLLILSFSNALLI